MQEREEYSEKLGLMKKKLEGAKKVCKAVRVIQEQGVSEEDKDKAVQRLTSALEGLKEVYHEEEKEEVE